MNKVLVALLGVGSLAIPGLVAAEGRMQPGLWEVIATLEVPGAATPLPATRQTECLTQKDVDADPVPSIDHGACRATDVHRSGGTITWKLVCDGSPAGEGKGEIIYRSPTAYDGWMTLTTAGATVRTKLQARRVGDC